MATHAGPALLAHRLSSTGVYCGNAAAEARTIPPSAADDLRVSLRREFLAIASHALSGGISDSPVNVQRQAGSDAAGSSR